MPPKKKQATEAEETEKPTELGYIPGYGIKKSTTTAKSSARGNFNEFLGYLRSSRQDEYGEMGTTMEELTMEQANSVALFERYAYWLVYKFKTNRGDGTSGGADGTCVNYIRSAGQQLMELHPGSGSPLADLSLPGNNFLSKIVGAMSSCMVDMHAQAGTAVRRLSN